MAKVKVLFYLPQTYTRRQTTKLDTPISCISKRLTDTESDFHLVDVYFIQYLSINMIKASKMVLKLSDHRVTYPGR